MLSIVRIIVGLLYMEHGLAKVLVFPLQPNHAPYALFNLNPGLQGLLELVGGLLLALGLFTRTVAFILAGDMAVAYFMAHALPPPSRGLRRIALLKWPIARSGWPDQSLSQPPRREVSSHSSMAGSWQSSTASCSFISGSSGAANGASIDYARPHPPYSRAAPNRGHPRRLQSARAGG